MPSRPIDALPSLSPAEIQRLTDPASYKRGQSYHRRGMIYRPIRRGNVLSASCRGSSGGPYEVRATLASEGREKVVGSSCTCPVGIACKHIVALLLTWSDNPAAFAERPPVDELLAGKERDDLVAIIRKLVELEPALEAAIEKINPAAPASIPPAKPGEAATVSAPIEQIQRRLEEALEAGYPEERDGWYDDEWGYDEPRSALDAFLEEEVQAGDIDTVVAESVETADRYETAGRIADAAAIFRVVALTCMDRFGEYESDPVFQAIQASGRGLLRCLKRQSDLPDGDRLAARHRAELLDALYEVWIFNGHGHWGHEGDTADDELIAALTQGVATMIPDPTDLVVAALSDEDRRALEQRWRADAQSGQGEEWRRRTAISFGVTLTGGDGFAPPELLEILTQAGLWWDLALLLLALGRHDDAIKLAARRLLDPQSALNFANILAGSGPDGPARAIRFIDERLWEVEGKQPYADAGYLTWLADAYAANGRTEEAIATRVRLFKLSPDLPRFRALEQVATTAGVDPERWATLRAEAMTTLAQKGNRASLVQIHLDAGDVRAALALVEDMSGSWGYGLDHYRDQVALAAEAEFPDNAIRIYRQHADRLIGYRGRDAYAQAAQYLLSARRVYQATGRDDEWARLIRDLREEHKKLRALQDEFNLAGL